MMVLTRACEATGDACPPYRYVCSLQVARKLYDLESYRLPSVAAAAGFAEFPHHDPSADALACAHIMIDAARRRRRRRHRRSRRGRRRADVAHLRSRCREVAVRRRRCSPSCPASPSRERSRRGCGRHRRCPSGGGHAEPMDALLVSAVAIGCLAAGVLAGWVAGAAAHHAGVACARSRSAAAARRQRRGRHGVQAQLDHQQLLYRELVGAGAHRPGRTRRARAPRAGGAARARAGARDAAVSMQSKVDELERDRHAQFGTLAEQLRQRAGVRRGAARDDRVARERAALGQHARRLGRDAAAPRRRGGGPHPLRRLRHCRRRSRRMPGPAAPTWSSASPATRRSPSTRRCRWTPTSRRARSR